MVHLRSLKISSIPIWCGFRRIGMRWQHPQSENSINRALQFPMIVSYHTQPLHTHTFNHLLFKSQYAKPKISSYLSYSCNKITTTQISISRQNWNVTILWGLCFPCQVIVVNARKNFPSRVEDEWIGMTCSGTQFVSFLFYHYCT